MDTFRAMQVFVSVADLKSFGLAARRHKLSPSAVTRLVGALEERVGTRLLQRTTRSVSLTEAGTRYLDRARRVLSEVAEAEAAAQSERAVPTGRLVVAAPNVFGRVHVAPVLAEFLSRHPAVRAELQLSDRAVSLVEEGIDVAVRIGRLDDSSQVARAVGVTRRVCVAAPGLLKRRRPRVLSDLAGLDTIHCTALAPQAEWRFVQDGKDRRVTIRPRFVTNSVDVAIAQAVAGGGVTIALGYQVLDHVRSGALQVVLADFEPEPLPIQLLYPSGRLLPASVRAFADRVAARRDWRFVELRPATSRT